ncbi:HMG (high mobility group) box domain containing protein-like protein, partial [Leptotrombidium deliense]
MFMRVVNNFRSPFFLQNVFANEIRARLVSTTAANNGREKTTLAPRKVKPESKIKKLSKLQLEEALLTMSKPKRGVNGYMLFVSDAMAEMRAKNESIKLAEVTQKCSEKWKKLSPQEKSKYEMRVQLNHENNKESIENYETLMNSVVTVKDAIAVFNSLLEKANSERKSFKRVSGMSLFMHDQSLKGKQTSLVDMHTRWNSVDEQT